MINLLHWFFYELPNNAQLFLIYLALIPIILGIGAYIDYLWNEKGW